MRNTCDFCKQKEQEINVYINWRDDKYPPEVVESLNALRHEICEHKIKCKQQNCFADKLINLIDTNSNIKKKKGGS